MKTLNEFTSLDEAKAYTSTRQRMIHKDSIVQFLTKHNCVNSLKNSDDEMAQGFYLAIVSGVEEYNVMESHPIGQENIQLLDYLVSIDAVNAAFRDACFSYGNTPYFPYESTTEHEFQLAKNNVSLSLVQAESGWVTIQTTQDCETHNPRLLAESPRTGKRVRVNSFHQVNTAGAYECQVPAEWRSAKLYVDNTYGVIR